MITSVRWYRCRMEYEMTVSGRRGASTKMMMKLLEDRCGWSMRTADMIALQSMLSRDTVMTTLTDEEFAVTRGSER